MARIRVKLADGRTGTIDDSEFNPQNMTQLNVPTSSPTPTQIATTPQNQSFLGNVGRDIGENVQGLLSLPGLLMGLASGKVSGGDVGEKLITGLRQEYGNLIRHPGKAFYEKPVSSILDILPFLQAGKLTKVGLAGKLAKTAQVAETATPITSDIANILSKAKKATVPTTTTASRMFVSNFIIPRKIASYLKPEETAKAILDYKLPASSIDDYSRIASQITGDSGILTNINRDALKYVPQISVEEVMPAVRNFVEQQATLKSDKFNVLKDIRSYLPDITSKIQGGKIGFAQADDIFNSMQQLEKQGYQLINSSTDLSPNLRNEQLGKAYLGAADELGLTLDKGVKSSGIINQFKTSEVLNAIGQISPKLAKQFQNAKSYADIRRLQKPFVRLLRMNEITQNAQSSPFGRLTQAATRGQGLGIFNQIPVLNTLLGRAGEGIGQAANVRGAQALTSTAPITDALGKVLSGAGKIAVATAKQPAAYIAGRQVLGTPQQQVEGFDPQFLEKELSVSAPTAKEELDTDEIQKVLTIAMIQDLASGGKNISKIQAISSVIDKLGQKKKETEQDIFLSKALDNIDAILEKKDLGYGPFTGRGAQASFSILGGTGVSKNIIDINQRYQLLKLNILRAYQGARISDKDYELTKYYTPAISDTQQTAKTKLLVLKEILSGRKNNPLPSKSIQSQENQVLPNLME